MKLLEYTVKISILTIILGILFKPPGFAAAETIDDHPHFYPYTKVLAEDYHLRLLVDHAESEIMLIFEDITENAVRIMPLKTIAAEVLFPGGETKMVEFKAEKNERKGTHRDAHPVLRLNRRKAGTFVYKADWIKDSPDFSLIVTFPFQGKDYKFVFDYSTGGDMYPYHMMR